MRFVNMVLLLAPLMLAGCTPSTDAALDYRARNAWVAPTTLSDWIIKGYNDYLLVDLRDKEAYDAAHIPGAAHLKKSALRDAATLRGLQTGVKLVFYGTDDELTLADLRPVFMTGAQILVVRGGYHGWEQQVLDPTLDLTKLIDRKRNAVAKYFKGESILGVPHTLESFSAQDLVRPPTIRPKTGGRPKVVNPC